MRVPSLNERKKLLLHLKCLLWCLHQMQTRYDLNLVLYSLEHFRIHSEIRDSNLGDNLNYILSYIDPEDALRLGDALRHLPESIGSLDMGEQHYEVGHYIQSLDDFGTITAGAYGVITAITPQFRGLFYLDGGHLMQSEFAPSDVRVIFGTYIV